MSTIAYYSCLKHSVQNGQNISSAKCQEVSHMQQEDPKTTRIHIQSPEFQELRLSRGPSFKVALICGIIFLLILGS